MPGAGIKGSVGVQKNQSAPGTDWHLQEVSERRTEFPNSGHAVSGAVKSLFDPPQRRPAAGSARRRPARPTRPDLREETRRQQLRVAQPDRETPASLQRRPSPFPSNNTRPSQEIPKGLVSMPTRFPSTTPHSRVREGSSSRIQFRFNPTHPEPDPGPYVS